VGGVAAMMKSSARARVRVSDEGGGVQKKKTKKKKMNS
jgi:hypothetical protein